MHDNEIVRISVSNSSVAIFRRIFNGLKDSYKAEAEEKKSDSTTLFEIKCDDPMFFYQLGRSFGVNVMIDNREK